MFTIMVAVSIIIRLAANKFREGGIPLKPYLAQIEDVSYRLMAF